jgi:PDDEXK-like domain of unknown function (DUF3799)
MTAAEELAHLLSVITPDGPSALELPPGLHHDVPASVYHAKRLGLVSNSALNQFAHSPATYRHWLTVAETPKTDAFSLGTALHFAALEPDEFARCYILEPMWGDCRKTANKEARDKWRAEYAGKTFLCEQDMTAIRGMTASLRAHPVIGALLGNDGRSEVTARWRDPETGLQCKARADRYSERWATILDLKTTDDARGSAFAHSCEKYHYDAQQALYERGFGACDAPVQHFVFGAVEKEPPYLCAAYTLHAESVREADDVNRGHMRRMAECLASNSWPGLQAEIQELTLRAWRLLK